ncbi:ribonuclease HII [Pseudarthrobacter sp. J1763]|uniref:ribonuclease HII n=1 Tax=Pseudarthrobacter sp. J1763 TaxID=3420445 RepID=UPI003D27807F
MAPTLVHELSLRTDNVRYLAAVDEVGRGALAGPVSVGIVVIDLHNPPELLAEVRDSKLLSAVRRESLVAEINDWAVGSAVGHASAAEIDQLGIVPALRLSGMRALRRLSGDLVVPDVVLLDGSHDWFSTPETTLFSIDPAPNDADLWAELGAVTAPVHTLVKADMTCLSVAAASVLAKVERDGLMAQLHGELPAYGWEGNKGYGTAAHRDAIREHGATDYHRKTWRLL